jgi:Phosphotransferase enzyme family
MDLDLDNIADYLLSRRLISRENIVDGDFLAIEMLRRNRNFKIRRADAPGLFVKQIRSRTPETVSCLEREARCYHLAQFNADMSELAPLMPRFIHYDAGNSILVLTLLETEALGQHYSRTTRLSAEIGEGLGSAIGSYHKHTDLNTCSHNDMVSKFGVFPRRTPWILNVQSLTFSEPPVGGAIAQLQSLLRRYPELADRIETLRNSWQIECLIHGDIRFDNCLIEYEEGVPKPKLKIVDWELTDLGDPCWDIAGILQSYLSMWVSSMPDSGVEPASLLIDRSKYKLEDIQRCICAFWQAYTLTRELKDNETVRGLTLRSAKYCAAWIVQTVYEISVGHAQLPPFGIRLLQLSDNMLADPEGAVADLLSL